MKTLIILFTFLSYFAGCESRSSSNVDLKSDSLLALNTSGTLSKEEYDYYHQLVSHYFDSTLLRGHFNGGILIAKDGAVIYENYFGYKNLKTKDTLTAETPLQIASTSKTFTSAAVLRLVQAGKLDLNTPITQFFPQLPYPGVTVKMLLNHRSGLPEYLYYMEKGGWNRNTFASNADVLNTLIQWQPPKQFTAGTRFHYCNTNFVLLALIVEKISGTSFPDYMKRYIFEPLKMYNTFIATVNDTSRTVLSFDGYGTKWKLDFSDGPYGDKNVYSTPEDLLKWDQSLYHNTILSQQTLDSAYTPYSNEKPSMHNYGLGWRLLFFPNGKKVVYHNGRWHGFNSAFARLTDERVTIIILSNKFNHATYTVARKLYNLFGDYDTEQKHEEGLE
ncbi:MAG: beta-lactamase family protein [Flavisolibacter sp.]|nr:beta-lactamase family protein [Flavisolibacter sp.]